MVVTEADVSLARTCTHPHVAFCTLGATPSVYSQPREVSHLASHIRMYIHGGAHT